MKNKIPYLLISVFMAFGTLGQFACSGGAGNGANANQPAANNTNAKTPSTPTTNPTPTAAANTAATTAPEKLPEGTKRISFDAGKSSATVSGGVIRGERSTYLLGAKSGQTMDVKITSEEDNAVFQIEGPNGKYLKDAGDGDDAMEWNGPLPAVGDYKIIVGGTRGNASFRLTVSIK